MIHCIHILAVSVPEGEPGTAKPGEIVWVLDKGGEKVYRKNRAKDEWQRRNFKMVFSRAGFFVILILIQLLVFLGIPYYLKEYATFIYSAMSVMEIVVLVYIINTEGNPAFKMTWMLCVMHNFRL